MLETIIKNIEISKIFDLYPKKASPLKRCLKTSYIRDTLSNTNIMQKENQFFIKSTTHNPVILATGK